MRPSPFPADSKCAATRNPQIFGACSRQNAIRGRRLDYSSFYSNSVGKTRSLAGSPDDVFVLVAVGGAGMNDFSSLFARSVVRFNEKCDRNSMTRFTESRSEALRQHVGKWSIQLQGSINRKSKASKMNIDQPYTSLRKLRRLIQIQYDRNHLS